MRYLMKTGDQNNAIPMDGYELSPQYSSPDGTILDVFGIPDSGSPSNESGASGSGSESAANTGSSPNLGVPGIPGFSAVRNYRSAPMSETDEFNYVFDEHHNRPTMYTLAETIDRLRVSESVVYGPNP